MPAIRFLLLLALASTAAAGSEIPRAAESHASWPDDDPEEFRNSAHLTFEGGNRGYGLFEGSFLVPLTHRLRMSSLGSYSRTSPGLESLVGAVGPEIAVRENLWVTARLVGHSGPADIEALGVEAWVATEAGGGNDPAPVTAGFSALRHRFEPTPGRSQTVAQLSLSATAEPSLTRSLSLPLRAQLSFYGSGSPTLNASARGRRQRVGGIPGTLTGYPVDSFGAGLRWQSGAGLEAAANLSSSRAVGQSGRTFGAGIGISGDITRHWTAGFRADTARLPDSTVQWAAGADIDLFW